MPRRNPLKPDINVTPLVDVVLVLLIIFMVVTPQMEAGAAVDLPRAAHPDGKAHTDQGPITVSVTATGALYLEKERLDDATLLERLRALHANDSTQRLVLKGDKAARYSDVRRLFKDCHEIGFPGVSLQVGKVDREGGQD